METTTPLPRFSIQDRVYACPIELGLSVVIGKWKLLILCRLRGETLRYGALYKQLPGISQKVLTQQLRELEADGIVQRQVYPVVPPQVEYRLTPAGEELLPVLDVLARWGGQYRLADGGVSSAAD
jgi:DNA-binding HxlR family transcriptional regulator